MKKYFWFIGILVVAALFIIIYIAVAHPSIKPPDNQTSSKDIKLHVAASINPIADMAAQIGGEHVQVNAILPPGASPHTFEPTPQHIRDAQDYEIIFNVGHGLDDWIQPIVDNAPGASVVTVDKNIQMRELPLDQRDDDEPDQTVDPHYWLTPTNAKIISQNIAAALEQTDPAHKDVYAANLTSYLAQLEELDSYIKNELLNLSSKQLITHHNAWGYFADAYGLQIAGTFEISPGKEPTPQQIADLQIKVKEHNVKTIFSEPQLSDESLKPFIQDLNLKTTVLDPEGGLANMGYIELMRYNAETIAGAL